MLRLNTPYLQPPPQPPGYSRRLPRDGGAHSSNDGHPCCGAACDDSGGGGAVVVTASHFLPHPSLPVSPFVPELRKAAGCGALLPLLDAVGSACHVYGHTHINGSAALEHAPAADGGARQCVACAAGCLAHHDGRSRDHHSQGKSSGRPLTAEAGAPPPRRRYVQYALEAAFERPGAFSRGGRGLPGLACVYDGSRVVEGLLLADITTGRLDG